MIFRETNKMNLNQNNGREKSESWSQASVSVIKTEVREKKPAEGGDTAVCGFLHLNVVDMSKYFWPSENKGLRVSGVKEVC